MIEKNNIYNLDCFELLKQIPDNSIDLVLIDPPYGLLNHKIETNIDIDKLVKECYRVLKHDSFFIYFGMQPTLTDWNKKAFELFNYKNEIIWHKCRSSFFLGDMDRMFENIMIVSKGKRKFNKLKFHYPDYLEDHANIYKLGSIESMCQKAKKAIEDKGIITDYIQFKKTKVYNTEVKKHTEVVVTDNSIKKPDSRFIALDIFTEGMKAKNFIKMPSHNTQQFNKDEFNLNHPTVKPIDLFRWLILLSTNKDDVVLDTFIGTGTTSLACIIEDRNYIGSELDSDYYKMAQDRICEQKKQGVLF